MMVSNHHTSLQHAPVTPHTPTTLLSCHASYAADTTELDARCRSDTCDTPASKQKLKVPQRGDGQLLLQGCHMLLLLLWMAMAEMTTYSIHT